MAEIDDRWQDLGAFIREQRRVGQLSLRRLSEMAGISNPYLSQIERGLRKPSAEILRQIAGALQISAETLYVRAGILDEPDGDHDLEASIRRDPYLDEEHKKTLIHIYRSFRSAFLGLHGEPERSADDPSAAAAGGDAWVPDRSDETDTDTDTDTDTEDTDGTDDTRGREPVDGVRGNGSAAPRDPAGADIDDAPPDDEPGDAPGT
jgi:transcriptional regulator with XRE-family HTH domain